MIQGIEHTAIASPDPHKLAHWYVEYLGFVINYQPEGSQTVFIRAADKSMIEIIESNANPRPPQELADPGLRHMAITVTDFDVVYARLKEQGIAFLTEPINNNGNRLVFFHDGDGNILHLLQREKPLP
jgi:glyoxylase I family protein